MVDAQKLLDSIMLWKNSCSDVTHVWASEDPSEAAVIKAQDNEYRARMYMMGRFQIEFGVIPEYHPPTAENNYNEHFTIRKYWDKPDTGK